MTLEIRRLRLSDEKAFMRALTLEEPDSTTRLAFYFDPKEPFFSYIETMRKKELGIGLQEGFVADTMLYGFVDGEIIGRINIRHELTEFLKNVGGHIGYLVLPKFRKKGYATEMLRLGLNWLRKEHPELKKILLTCDQGNMGSQKTIEKNGGVFENTFIDNSLKIPKRRYWISL